MKSEAWIPIVVGVTGHRSIRQADRPALYAAVRESFQSSGPAAPTPSL